MKPMIGCDEIGCDEIGSQEIGFGAGVLTKEWSDEYDGF